MVPVRVMAQDILHLLRADGKAGGGVGVGKDDEPVQAVIVLGAQGEVLLQGHFQKGQAVEGGEHRVIARYKWLDKSYIWQAERIRELVGRYNFRHIGVDVTGPGIGVFEQIRAFFPLATPINYSVQLKTQLVLKAKELIEAHRLKWDAGQNDIAHAFLTIRQGVTDSGQISYSASRTSATAWLCQRSRCSR